MQPLITDVSFPLYQRLRDQPVRKNADNCWGPGDAMPTEAAVDEVLGLAPGEPVIRLLRLRLFDQQPVFVEEILLHQHRVGPLLDIDQQGPLLYPIDEELCGLVIASAEETLTAERRRYQRHVLTLKK